MPFFICMTKTFRPINRPSSAPDFDPKTQPVIALEPADKLSTHVLELDFIRRAFTQPVDWQVDPLFTDAFASQGPVPPGFRQAAVLMPLVQRDTGVNVIFTRRAAHLSDHAGQVSFPGGCIEISDQDAIVAALRETEEEIGVGLQFIELMGTQPSLMTTTRFQMQPVVGALRPGFELRADPNEVAEIFEVPLSVLMDPGQHSLHRTAALDNADRHYFSMTWQSHFIWGATAALVRNFYRFLVAAQQADQR